MLIYKIYIRSFFYLIKICIKSEFKRACVYIICVRPSKTSIKFQFGCHKIKTLIYISEMEKICKLSIQSIYKSMFLTIELDIIKTWPLVIVSVKGN